MLKKIVFLQYFTFYSSIFGTVGFPSTVFASQKSQGSTSCVCDKSRSLFQREPGFCSLLAPRGAGGRLLPTTGASALWKSSLQAASWNRLL